MTRGDPKDAKIVRELMDISEAHPSLRVPSDTGGPDVPIALLARGAHELWSEGGKIRKDGSKKEVLLLEHHQHKPAGDPMSASHGLSFHSQVKKQVRRAVMRHVKRASHESRMAVAAEKRMRKAMERAEQAAQKAQEAIVHYHRVASPAAASASYTASASEAVQRWQAARSPVTISVSSSSSSFSVSRSMGGGGGASKPSNKVIDVFLEALHGSSGTASHSKSSSEESSPSSSSSQVIRHTSPATLAALGAFGLGSKSSGTAVQLAENKSRGIFAAFEEAFGMSSSSAAPAEKKKRGRKPKGESAPKRIKAMSAPKKGGKKKSASAAGKKKKSKKAKAKAVKKAKAKAKTNLKKRAPRPVVVVVEEKKQKKKGGKKGGNKKKKAVLAPVSFVSAHTRSHSKK
jgi:hypothetical protein